MKILFYHRYVDDICIAVSPSKINILLQRFNSFHPRLQFTIEIGGEKLDFLDATISISIDSFFIGTANLPSQADF